MPTPLRFELTTPTDDDRPVFITGNFCDWYPDLESFRMQPLGGGRYALDFPAVVLPDVLEYKYTRGGWEHVELAATSEPVQNRTTRRRTGIRGDYVPHWRWYGHPYNADFLPGVELIDDAFDLPQLQTTRRIRVLLPHDYGHSDKLYPVLYLQDGQNLAGEGSSHGSWEIDRQLAILASRRHHEVIIVSIDHGHENRIREFTLDPTRAGVGQGLHYLNFVAQTVKPYVDAHFRTLPDAAHTGIGGSSLGGLISVYGGVLFPGVFGRWLVFSPSLWIAPKLTDAIRGFNPSLPVRVYLYGGQKESAHMVASLDRLSQSLRDSPGGQQTTVHTSIEQKGTHQETWWGWEFPKALEWLFYERSTL
ncbi:MAG: alpha/beta hydrolase [Bacteroidetes bacterium]|nr:alpha/beta hydrolase [Fibrella sp.]